MAGQVFTQMAAYSFLLLILWNQGIVRDESLGRWESVNFPWKEQGESQVILWAHSTAPFSIKLTEYLDS